MDTVADTAIANETIEMCLERILTTEEFVRSPQIKDLLRYLVDATLKGEGDRLKGYTIGVDVFGRGESFDPGYDSIVRVQASRLRRALENYYQQYGFADPLQIDIPKGGYAVRFQQINVNPSEPGKDATSYEPVGINAFSAAHTVSLAILPFAALDGEGDQAVFADALVDELTIGLARNKSFSLTPRSSAFQFRGPADLRHVGRQLNVSYLVDGSVRRKSGKARISISLTDTGTGATIWAQRYDWTMSDEFDEIDELAGRIMQDIQARLYSEIKRRIEAKPENERNDWEHFLLATWTPGDDLSNLQQERAHVGRPRQALKLNPKSGKAHSVIADKLAHLANIDPTSDTEQMHREAALHARSALDLDPNDADVVFNVVVYYWNTGRVSRCRSLTRRLLELEPNHQLASLLGELIEFGVTRVPQPVIDKIVAFESELPRTNMSRWVMLFWISLLHFNNGNYAASADYSARAHEIRKGPENVFRLAAALVQTGEQSWARELVNEVKYDWPTIDLHHYAGVVVPRRYKGSPIFSTVQDAYFELAEVYTGERLEDIRNAGNVVPIKSSRTGKS